MPPFKLWRRASTNPVHTVHIPLRLQSVRCSVSQPNNHLINVDHGLSSVAAAATNTNATLHPIYIRVTLENFKIHELFFNFYIFLSLPACLLAWDGAMSFVVMTSRCSSLLPREITGWVYLVKIGFVLLSSFDKLEFFLPDGLCLNNGNGKLLKVSIISTINEQRLN